MWFPPPRQRLLARVWTGFTSLLSSTLWPKRARRFFDVAAEESATLALCRRERCAKSGASADESASAALKLPAGLTTAHAPHVDVVHRAADHGRTTSIGGDAFPAPLRASPDALSFSLESLPMLRREPPRIDETLRRHPSVRGSMAVSGGG